jgi:peroxisomal 3,2-trans-enoyl-CoA isomerase
MKILSNNIILNLGIFRKLFESYRGDLKAGSEARAKLLQKFVATFIDFTKPLIGAINGPTIGIAVETLGLMDCVIASKRATFRSPFSSLSQSPKACATYAFPLL